MTTTRLPLFPLNAVLFPGLVMPLIVFEERYQALVRTLLEIPEGEPRLFGVIGIRDGFEVAQTGAGLPGEEEPPPAGPADGFGPDPARSFYSVGCVADASTIKERADGAGFELLATGTTRFTLQSVDASGDFLAAEIEELPEDTGDSAGTLSEGVLRAFRAYQKRLANAHERTLTSEQELPEDPSVVSYLVAAAAVLDTATKQRLLQAPDTATRLADELRLLRRETAVLGQLPSLPAADLTHRPTFPN